MDINNIVTELDNVLDSPIKWRPEETDRYVSAEVAADVAQYDPVTFIGEGGGWRIVVVSFSIEDQGFPKGTRGYDGTAKSSCAVVKISG